MSDCDLRRANGSQLRSFSQLDAAHRPCLYGNQRESLGCAWAMGVTILQRLVGDVRVVVRTVKLPTPRDVEDLLRGAIANEDHTRVVLVAMVGDGADYRFDFDLRAKLSGAGLFSKPVAILAPSIRPDLVESLKWVGAEIRCFGPDGFEDACDLLAIAPSLRPKLRETLTALKEHIGSSFVAEEAAAEPEHPVG